MELNERIEVAIQAAELAQKAGVLSLDDAYYAKLAVDALKSGQNLEQGFSILLDTADLGQEKGAYTLRDAYYIYSAFVDIESVLQGLGNSQPEPMPAPEPEVQAPTRTRKK